MISIKIDKSRLNLPNNFGLTGDQKNQIASKAISDQEDRLRKGIGADDAAMPNYSDKPLYIPISGSVGRAGALFASRAHLSTRQVTAISKKSTVVDLRDGSRSVRSRRGRKQLATHRLRRSLKFRNRSEYKRNIGQSGVRTLFDTGEMLNSVRATSISRLITISVTGNKNIRKAIGNLRWANWWGVSPSSQTRLAKMAEVFGVRNIQEGREGQ